MGMSRESHNRLSARILAEEQVRLAAMMKGHDRNYFASAAEVRACIDALDEDGLRPFNYDYYYVNLLAIFGHIRNIQEVRKLAMQCNKFRLWSRWEFYSEPYRADNGRSAGVEPRLAGWDSGLLASLLRKKRGLVIYTSHYGAFRNIYNDVKLISQEPWISVDADSAAGFHQRTLMAEEHLRSGEKIPSKERVINVEDSLGSLRIASLLKNNEIVVAFADGNSGLDGPWGESNKVCVNLLGYQVTLKAGVAKIAASVGAPVLPVLTRRTASMHGGMEPFSMVGEVKCKQPIVPEGRLSGIDRDAFVAACVSTTFGHIEQAVLDDPTQWESACLFHRWRGKQQAPVREGVEHGGNGAHAICGFQGGERVRMSHDHVACVPTNEGAMLVNVQTMRVFKVKKDLEGLLDALMSDSGVGQEWCAGHRGLEGICTVTKVLAEFERLGLVHKT
jgi:hypothetical protein